jgi:hypothetical protein
MAKKEKKEKVHATISQEDAATKVMGLIQMWFKLKTDLKETAAAYKEKIKGIEQEIEETLADAEATKAEEKK